MQIPSATRGPHMAGGSHSGALQGSHLLGEARPSLRPADVKLLLHGQRHRDGQGLQERKKAERQTAPSRARALRWPPTQGCEATRPPLPRGTSTSFPRRRVLGPRCPQEWTGAVEAPLLFT